MSFLNQAQAVAQQATVVAQNIAGNVVRTVAALKLEQYYQPLLNDLTKTATPHFNTLSAAVSKHSGPYMKAAAPYLGEGKTYLDRIPHKETALLLGGIFGGVLLLQLFLMLTATCRRGASKLKAFTPTVFWLLMCFIIHSWIEYSFVFHRNNGQSGFENGMNLYGAADYRYGFGKHMELEAGTAAMEAITAFLSGPLCLFLAWGIVGNKPWRWPLQIVTCTCQIYGLLWFSAHPLFSSEQVASEDPFLYWVIFIGFNAPWGIVPPIMLYTAFSHIYRTLVKAEKNAQITPGSPSEKKAAKKQ